MSFLNPITLTSKLYQSTDRDAPPLNGQNGDLKTIFKACLVTGYGDKEGAGYTLDNETTTSCDFISPDIAMNKIGVGEDNTYFLFYYYHGGKKFQGQSTVHTKSYLKRPGWAMVVSERGLYFIVIDRGHAYLTYLGMIKSAINDNNINMGVFSVGFLGSWVSSGSFWSYNHIGPLTNVKILSNATTLLNSSQVNRLSLINLTSEIFFYTESSVIGLAPGLLIQNGASFTPITEYQGREVISFVGSLGGDHSVTFGIMIYLDHWEY